jgi:hypothetical protein
MTTSGPDPDARLLRRSDLDLTVDASNQAFVRSESGVVACGHFGLALLDLFARPMSLRAALELLRPRLRGAQDWIDASSTVVRLFQQGILVDEAAAPPTLHGRARFDAPSVHVRMLDDHRRVAAYLEGIAATVREGDVVVDIGTGTGILALAAIRAGARHVYAIEAGEIGRAAERVFEANGVADRVTLVPGWSTQVELPERADVLVSEIIGNEPLDEHVLEAFADARRRLLVPGARFVPSRLRVVGLGMTAPHEWVTERAFTPTKSEEWRAAYGFDFTPLLSLAGRSPAAHYVRAHRPREWQSLTGPITLADLDLTQVSSASVDTVTEVRATAAGSLNGLLVYFELDVGGGVRLSTSPYATDERCHWSSVLWLVPDPIDLATGDVVKVRYAYGAVRSAGRVDIERVDR